MVPTTSITELVRYSASDRASVSGGNRYSVSTSPLGRRCLRRQCRAAEPGHGDGGEHDDA